MTTTQDYTPTVDEAEDAWAHQASAGMDDDAVARAEFRRMLAAEGRRWSAEAWDESAREAHSLGWLHDWALSDTLARNPYRGA